MRKLPTHICRDLDDDDEEGLAGWPPLHSWRKRLMEENHHERVDQINNINVMNNNDELFVKVKMDGVAIARKIDLNAFNSYQMLTTALIHMFDKCKLLKYLFSYIFIHLIL